MQPRSSDDSPSAEPSRNPLHEEANEEDIEDFDNEYGGWDAFDGAGRADDGNEDMAPLFDIPPRVGLVGIEIICGL